MVTPSTTVHAATTPRITIPTKVKDPLAIVLGGTLRLIVQMQEGGEVPILSYSPGMLRSSAGVGLSPTDVEGQETLVKLIKRPTFILCLV